MFIKSYLTSKISIIYFIFAIICLSFFSSEASALIFQWNSSGSDNVDGYRIYYRTENENTYNYNIPLWEGSETTCNISSLTLGVKYFFVIRAYNFCGMESIDSDEVEIIFENSDDYQNDSGDVSIDDSDDEPVDDSGDVTVDDSDDEPVDDGKYKINN